jgi:hypothetical protein
MARLVVLEEAAVLALNAEGSMPFNHRSQPVTDPPPYAYTAESDTLPPASGIRRKAHFPWHISALILLGATGLGFLCSYLLDVTGILPWPR